MKILLFVGFKNRLGEKIIQVLGEYSTPDDLEIYRTVDALSARLQKHIRNVSMVILLASDRNDFSDLYTIRDLLIDLRILLILPDSDKDTMTRAYSLYPRYIHYLDNDFNDVVAVMERMYKTAVDNQAIEEERYL